MGYASSLSSLSKSATEIGLDASEIVLLISGFILLLGAVGEYAADHSKLPKSLAWPKLVFILMVAVSLLGEWLGDAGVYLFSAHLQSISDSENLKLVAALQPRRLTPSQLKLLSTSFSPYAGKVIAIQSYASDVEAAVLAMQIKDSLVNAHVIVRDMIAAVNSASLPIFFGVHVDSNSRDGTTAKAITDILGRDGKLSVIEDKLLFGQGTMMYVGPEPAADVIILVGIKALSDVAQ
jgi:hypothetical protein